MPKDKIITRCPHCGLSECYFRKVTFSGKGFYHYSFNEPSDNVDNSSLHDYVIYKESKIIYCSSYGKKIGSKPQ